MYLISHQKKKKDETDTYDPAGGDSPSPKRPTLPDDPQTSGYHSPSPKISKQDCVLPQTPIGWTSPRKPGSTTSSPGSTVSTPMKDSSQDKE